MKRKLAAFGVGASLVAVAAVAAWHQITLVQTGPKPGPGKHSTPVKSKAVPPERLSTTKSKLVAINLDKAVAVSIPETKAPLTPTAFKTPDGKTGWVIRLPEDRPIATPAYANGLLYVGGGYGSHEFYAFNAQTGEKVWEMKTKDDGPTAAVVEDGCVAFNTESCTLVVADAKTGKVLWEEWLGDPLMSQPAISHGRLYMAYPAGQRGHGSHGYKLLCADLHTGKHLWEQTITGDAITAPVIDGDRVYVTCMDGTSFCMVASTGEIVWKKANSGTSAPLIAGGNVVTTQKEVRAGKTLEGIRRLEAKKGADRDRQLVAKGPADYLGEGKGGGVAMSGSQSAKLDSSVGFSAAPAAAGMPSANKNIGVQTVVGGWAYQGSRAAYKGGQIMNAQGRYLNSVRSKDGRVTWRAEAQGKAVAKDSQVFVPPALGNKNMYLCSTAGHFLSVSQRDGKLGFMYLLKQPVAFQPALAGGNMYVGTANGMLICLKTGDKDADGWVAWGGNAQHNKK